MTLERTRAYAGLFLLYMLHLLFLSLIPLHILYFCLFFTRHFFPLLSHILTGQNISLKHKVKSSLLQILKRRELSFLFRFCLLTFTFLCMDIYLLPYPLKEKLSGLPIIYFLYEAMVHIRKAAHLHLCLINSLTLRSVNPFS